MDRVVGMLALASITVSSRNDQVGQLTVVSKEVSREDFERVMVSKFVDIVVLV